MHDRIHDRMHDRIHDRIHDRMHDRIHDTFLCHKKRITPQSYRYGQAKILVFKLGHG
jgi:hypothetical protein